MNNEEMNRMVWAEKYRPKTLEDAILSEETKKMVRDSMANGNIPNLLLSGSAGTGKTTLARCIANDMGADLMFINASLQGIDAIRTDVIQFSSSVSFGDGIKIVLFDEFDGASSASQNSMRGIIEEFPQTRFFFTCNFKNKVIDAIHSRCVVIDFKTSKEESPKLQSKFFKRVTKILELEGIEYDKAVVAELVRKSFPDFRSTLNQLQRYAASGKIDSGILLNQTESAFSALFVTLKDKNFTGMRKWIGENADIEPMFIFRTLYDQSSSLLSPKCIPNIVILLADYSYKCSMVADTQILVAACLTEFMVGAEWK